MHTNTSILCLRKKRELKLSIEWVGPRILEGLHVKGLLEDLLEHEHLHTQSKNSAGLITCTQLQYC